MKKRNAAMMAAALTTLTAGCAGDGKVGDISAGNTRIEITCDRTNSLFVNGETAKFTVMVYRDNVLVRSGKLSVLLAPDGGPGNARRHEFDLSAGNPGP